MIIYFITFVIILLSFALITGLVYIQDNYVTTDTNTNDNVDAPTSNFTTILNICISLGLQVVNKILWLALFYLLDLEYNHTLTQKIISQMNKVLFATSINIIVLPIISNYVLRSNFFGSKGLAGMVFDYQISVLTVGLMVKLTDP
jgi:hypothetical protein